MAIGTDDVYRTAEAVKLNGGKITREPGPLPGINTKITACLDPDGWKTVLPLHAYSLFMSSIRTFIFTAINWLFRHSLLCICIIFQLP